MYVCVCCCLCSDAHEGQKSAEDTLELGLQVIESFWEQNSGTLKEQCALLKHRAFSPIPGLL